MAPKQKGGKPVLLRDSIYRAIRQAVLTCEFQPGQELREQVLAERYRVSRSPVRDSLLRLEQENLVTVLPRQGYRVRPILASDVEDLFGLHLLIEPACAAAAAIRSDDEALRALDRFRGFVLDNEVEFQSFVDYNQSFHRTIANLSGNARLTAVALDLNEQFERLVRISLHMFKYEIVREAGLEHGPIIDALQTRNANLASRLSHEHSARAHSRMVTALGLIAQQGGSSAASPTTMG